MINPHSQEDAAVPDGKAEIIQLVPQPGAPAKELLPALKLRPNGNNLWIDYRPDNSDHIEGGVIIPGKARKLDFVTAIVLARGPKCEMVEVDDKIIVAAKGIVNGEQGIIIEGRRVYVTQEQLVVAVVEKPQKGK